MPKEKTEVISRQLYENTVHLNFYPKSHKYTLAGSKDRLISVTSVTGLLDKSVPMRFWAVNLACDYLLEVYGPITKADIEEARKQHTLKTDEAATTGTAVHAYAEARIRALLAGSTPPEPPDDPQVLSGALAFLKWEKAHIVRYLSSERLVWSPLYEYVGTCDCEAIVKACGGNCCPLTQAGKEQRRVVDFKTSKKRKRQKGDKLCICKDETCGGVYSEHRYQVAAYQKAIEEEDGITAKDLGHRIIARFDKETGEFSAHELDEFHQDFAAFKGLLDVKNRERQL